MDPGALAHWVCLVVLIQELSQEQSGWSILYSRVMRHCVEGPQHSPQFRNSLGGLSM